MSGPADKPTIRARIRAARQGLPAEERAPLARSAAGRALALPELADVTHVLGFAAAPEELDPAPLLEALRARGAVVCLPRIAGPGALSLHVCEVSDRLQPGPFGLLQPSPDAEEAYADRIDLVIVPGVAFDAGGRRLGFGGGYYDRLLAGMPHATRLALAYDAQLIARVPTEAHDEPVDLIVTPTRVLRVPGRRR